MHRRHGPSRPATRSTPYNRGKSILLAVIGRRGPVARARTSARPIPTRRGWTSSPTPSMKTAELAYLKTHHYGGIRKYQWVTVPLELHGKVVRARRKRDLRQDRRMTPPTRSSSSTDLLPHLGPRAGQKAPQRGHSVRIASTSLIGSWPEAGRRRPGPREALPCMRHPAREIRHRGGGFHLRRAGGGPGRERA